MLYFSLRNQQVVRMMVMPLGVPFWNYKVEYRSVVSGNEITCLQVPDKYRITSASRVQSNSRTK